MKSNAKIMIRTPEMTASIEAIKRCKTNRHAGVYQMAPFWQVPFSSKIVRVRKLVRHNKSEIAYAIIYSLVVFALMFMVVRPVAAEEMCPYSPPVFDCSYTLTSTTKTLKSSTDLILCDELQRMATFASNLYIEATSNLLIEVKVSQLKNRVHRLKRLCGKKCKHA